eukprot:m.7292 g.7292  ORF g.7292 m.7292 type:complete len:130 (-) comp5560_c0_seq2:11-400(-)
MKTAIFMALAIAVSAYAATIKLPQTIPSKITDVSTTVVPVSESHCVQLAQDKAATLLDSIREKDGVCSSQSCQTCANFCGQGGYTGYCCDGQDDPDPGMVYCCCGNGGNCTGSCRINDCNVEAVAKVNL